MAGPEYTGVEKPFIDQLVGQGWDGGRTLALGYQLDSLAKKAAVFLRNSLLDSLHRGQSIAQRLRAPVQIAHQPHR